MAEKDRISQPTQGSEKPGTEATETHSRGMSAGTDTQTKMAAASAQQKKEKDQHKSKSGINDDEKVVRNSDGTSTFPDSTQTDE